MFFRFYIKTNFAHPPPCPKLRKAFTLAEILITLSIIGIVAIIVIPSMVTSVTNRARSTQILLSQRKFQKAAELMTLNGEMGPYYSDAQDFMETFRKYLKVNAICRVSDEPSDLPSVETCWGDDYPGITLENGKTIALTKITDGASFGILTADKNNSWATSTVAFLDIDGTRRIIAYNTKCPDVPAGVYQGDTSSACIAGVADVDAAKKPNTLNKDVYLFGSAQSLGGTCPVGTPIGLCYTRPKLISDVVASRGYTTHDECVANYSAWGMYSWMCETASTNPAYGSDLNWFASIVRECGTWGRILSHTDLAKILNYTFDTTYFTSSTITNATTYKVDDNAASRLAQFGLPDPRATGSYAVTYYTVYQGTMMSAHVLISANGTSLGTSNMFGDTYSGLYLFCWQNQNLYK